MEAPRDQNRKPVIMGVSNIDGSTPTAPYVNPTTHELMVDNGSTGTDLSGDEAYRDGNRVTTMIGVSSDDGVTPVPVYVDSVTKKLLVSLL